MRQETLFILSLLTTSGAENIAFGKRSSYCEVNLEHEGLVDGVKTLTEGVVMARPCLLWSFVDISWDVQVFIYHVVVYEGLNSPETALDYFVVELPRGDNVMLCSHYAFPATELREGQGMHVNCRLTHTTSGIRVRSRSNLGMVITEIEAHSLGRGRQYYVGCVGQFKGETEVGKSFEQCQEFCSRGSPVFAMKNNRTCSCGSSYTADYAVDIQECILRNSTLPNTGGPSAYALYLSYPTFPLYDGCYYMKPAVRTMKAMASGEMTIARCILTCDRSVHAILRNGSDCLCADSDLSDITEALVTHPINCEIKCSADDTKTCGGTDTLSVYRTCYDHLGDTLPCSALFRCSTDWDEMGVCLGACLPGYHGLHCLDLATIINMCEAANPCLTDPNAKCVWADESYSCHCIPLYERNATGFCEKISDSCLTVNPCLDLPFTYCSDKDGIIECLCTEGRKKTIFGNCEESEPGKLKIIKGVLSGAVLTTGAIFLVFYISYKVMIKTRSTPMGSLIFSHPLIHHATEGNVKRISMTSFPPLEGGMK